MTVIPMPVDVVDDYLCVRVTATRADSGGLGFLIMIDFTAQLWKRETDCGGVASWVMERTIELDKLLSLNLKDKWHPMILGFAEDNNVVFVWTMVGLFAIQLQSLHFKNLHKINITSHCRPFESVYTTGNNNIKHTFTM